MNKKILISVDKLENGLNNISFSNSGFSDLEIIGLCELIRTKSIVQIINQINKNDDNLEKTKKEAGDELS